MNDLTFRPLLEWYRQRRRPLPWRQTRDPYAILVSEFMLQQTRVETVIPYYSEFLKRFPDTQSLSRASSDELNQAWAGLGYYRRVHNLQRAARLIEELGYFPQTREELRRLPGVGDYTAAALASIAFGQPALALDGNALRVLARVFGLRQPVESPTLQRQLKQQVEPFIPRGEAGDFTQAVMELGATLCLPRPKCPDCPLHKSCQAHQQGAVAEIPQKKPRRARVKLEAVAFVVWSPDGNVYLEKKSEREFLADQWLPPWGWLEEKENLLTELQARLPGTRPERRAHRVKHAITYRDLEVEIWEWASAQEPLPPELHHFSAWKEPESRLPALATKIIRGPVRSGSGPPP